MCRCVAENSDPGDSLSNTVIFSQQDLLHFRQMQHFYSCFASQSPHAEQSTHPDSSLLFTCWPIDQVSRLPTCISKQLLLQPKHKSWSTWTPSPNHYSFLSLTHTAFWFPRCTTSYKHTDSERSEMYTILAKISAYRWYSALSAEP